MNPAAPVRALRLDGVEKQFGRRRVLRGLTLGFDAGQVVALVGPNGAGKSTLLRIMVGALAPDAGHVAVEGVDPMAHGSARPPVGYVADGAPLPLDASVRGFLRRSAALRFAAAADRSSYFDAASSRFGIGDVLDRTVGALSRGWRQRVALAAVLAAKCRLLVLDEPSTGLDPATQRLLWDDLAQHPSAVVVIASHDLAEIAATATRVVRVEAGAVGADCPLSLPPGFADEAERLSAIREVLA